MSFLENYQSLTEEDEFAKHTYEGIRIASAEAEPETPMLGITIRLHFRTAGRDAISEKLAYLVPETEFMAVRSLADHYLTEYDTLHILDDPGGTSLMRAHVVVTEELASISLLAERIARTDEDIRRSRFRDSANAMGLDGGAQTLGNPDTDLDLSDFGPRDPSGYNPFRDQL